MKYTDKKGNKYEISYSQKLQQKIVGELKRSQKLQKNNTKLMVILIFLFALILVLALVAFIYLDQRDAITYIGRTIFCKGLSLG